MKRQCNQKVNSAQLCVPRSLLMLCFVDGGQEAAAKGKAASWTSAVPAACAVKPHPSLWETKNSALISEKVHYEF